MAEIEELKACDCGCIFFNEVKAKTYTENKFIFYGEGLKANLQNEDTTIPVAICISCGKIHVPRTSFNGMNSMDRSVKLYSKLLSSKNEQDEKMKPVIKEIFVDENTVVSKKSKLKTEEKKEEQDVSAESISSKSTEDVVQPNKTRSRSKQSNKK